MALQTADEQLKQDHLYSFIQQIMAASANLDLYNQSHPQTLMFIHKALESLSFLFESTGLIELKIIEGRLVCNNSPVTTNFLISKFIHVLSLQQINFIKFKPGINDEELKSFAKIIGKTKIAASEKLNSEHITYGVLEVRYRKEDPAENGHYVDFSEIATSHVDGFMDIYQRIRKKQKLNIVGIQDIVHDFVDAFHSHNNILLAIAPLRDIDDYIYVHSTNICLLNMAQARLLNLDADTLNEIGVAAMLHDVGKMFISSDILNKKEKLTAEEWSIMKQHPKLGAEYLLSCSGIPSLAVINAYEHHIGYDGKGYPSPASPHQLHPCSYMTSISDVYDALRTRRSYKEPLSFQEIKEIMLGNAGKSLHPELTSSFMNAISKIESEKPTP